MLSCCRSHRYLGPHAPHYPATPAPWYADAFPDLKVPLTPNYNVSSPNKTQHIRQNPPLSALAHCWQNQHFKDRWQTLLSARANLAALHYYAMGRVSRVRVLDLRYAGTDRSEPVILCSQSQGNSPQAPFWVCC